MVNPACYASRRLVEEVQERSDAEDAGCAENSRPPKPPRSPREPLLLLIFCCLFLIVASACLSRFGALDEEVKAPTGKGRPGAHMLDSSDGCRHSTAMPSKRRGQSRIELLQGTLDMIILQTLRWGPRHGYGIAQLIRASSNESLQVDTGSLYPALHRLEKQEWIAAEWGVSENRQRVRVYRLTAAGKKQLVSERSRWEQLSQAIAGIMRKPQESES